MSGDSGGYFIGAEIVQQETSAYAFSNELYETFDLVRFLLDIVLNKDADFVGSNGAGIRIFDKKKNA